MIRIRDKEYRNLEEQVQKNKEDIARHYEIDRALANLGIQIVGQVLTADLLPDPLTYAGVYGDAFAVGNPAAVAAGTGYYTYYVFTRPDPDAGTPEDHWLNVGRISIVGPQGVPGPVGPPGPEGEPGSLWYSGPALPTISADMKDGFQALNTTTGDVYQLKTTTNGRSWVLTGNIRGPQGIQGIPGPQGDPGPTGPQGIPGPTGDVGGFINIRGILSNVNQLPEPTTLNNLTVAYLVGTAAPYDLYVQIGETSATATWNNAGAFNAATLVTVGGVGQNVWEADTKLDKITTPTYQPVEGAGPIDGKIINGVVYFLRYDGTNMTAPVGIQSRPGTIPSRDSASNFYVGSPTFGLHCTNKDYVDKNFVAKSEYIHTPIATYNNYCSSANVAVGTPLSEWLYNMSTISPGVYSVYGYSVQGWGRATIKGTLGGTLALGDSKTCVFFTDAIEGNCILATEDINIDNEATGNAEYVIDIPINAKYMYISTNFQSNPSIQR